MVPESTTMTTAPPAEPATTAVRPVTRTTEPTTQSQANRQRVRMEQREKIKEEILKRRELETPCTTESLVSWTAEQYFSRIVKHISWLQ